MLIQLGKHRADVKMGVSLRFGSLQTAFNGESSLQKIEGGPHLTNPAIVARHVVEGHGLPQLIVLAQLLRFL